MRGALVPPGLFDTACRGWAKPSVGLVTVCLGTWEHCVHVLTYAAIVFPCNGCVCVPGTMCQGSAVVVRDWWNSGTCVPGPCRVSGLCFSPLLFAHECFSSAAASDRPRRRFCVCKLFHAVRTGFKKECGARTAFFSFACGGTCAGVL